MTSRGRGRRAATLASEISPPHKSRDKTLTRGGDSSHNLDTTCQVCSEGGAVILRRPVLRGTSSQESGRRHAWEAASNPFNTPQSHARNGG